MTLDLFGTSFFIVIMEAQNWGKKGFHFADKISIYFIEIAQNISNFHFTILEVFSMNFLTQKTYKWSFCLSFYVI